MEQYLQETYYFDFSDAAIQSLVADFRHLPQREQVSGLFRKVRDDWRYNPYTIYSKPAHYRASFIAGNPEGHCIDKTTLFVAALRAVGIPARLRLAKVANHIAVERLTKVLGTNYIAPHGIAEAYIDDRWVKASTAFNKTLCDKFNVDALEFDGSQDAVFQAFNRDQNKFMEYVEDYGHFEDVPLDRIQQIFHENYPALFKEFGAQERITI